MSHLGDSSNDSIQTQKESWSDKAFDV